MAATGIPRRWRLAGIREADGECLAPENFIRTAAVKAVHEGVHARPSGNVVLHSPYIGTGKTIAAMHWLAQKLDADPVVHLSKMVVYALELNRLLMSDRVAAFRRYFDAPYLVIEDLGDDLVDTTPRATSMMGQAIARRLLDHRPTLISTPWHPTDLVRSYGGRFWGILREHSSWCVYTTKTSMRSGEVLRFEAFGPECVVSEPPEEYPSGGYKAF